METEILKLLITQIDWKNTKVPKDQNKLALLQQRIAQLANAPNFASLICTYFLVKDRMFCLKILPVFFMPYC